MGASAGSGQGGQGGGTGLGGVIGQAANIANTGMQGANQALTRYPQPQGGGVGIDSTVSDNFGATNQNAGAGLNGTLINRAYGDLFGRSPDAGGAASWGAHLANGMAPSEMLRHMSESPEFQAQQDYSRGYTSVFRPGYKEYGPNGQFYQPIYQPQYQNYMQPMGGAFGGYGMPMGGGMRGMGGMMQGLGMPSRGDSPIPPAPPTVPSNISQSGGIGSGGALNFTYAEGGIADLLDK